MYGHLYRQESTWDTISNRIVMNIIGLCASPRGEISRTRLLVQQVLNGSKEKGAEVEFIDLCSLSIGFCNGCETCNETGICVIDDDCRSLAEKMKWADGVVLGSPVYVDNVTAQMKAFIDRMADSIHYQILGDKYGCSVVTTWGSGGEEVLHYLDHVLHYLGAQTIGGIRVALGDDGAPLRIAMEKSKECGEILAESIRIQRHFPEQERWISENREFFARIVKKNRNVRPHEYAEWVKKGWIATE